METRRRRERYYLIDALGNVQWYLWGDSSDTLYYKAGNCFRTREEAEEVAGAWKCLLNKYHENKNLNWSSSSELMKLFTDALKNTGSLTDNSKVAKLPDWCKVNAWIFDYNELEYAQVKNITGEIEDVDLVYIGTEERATKSRKYINDCCFRANVRPYCDKEMKQLVGKILDNGTRRAMVTACFSTYFPARPRKRVFMVDEWYTAEELIKYGYTLDGKPCGKLVHKDGDNWVE